MEIFHEILPLIYTVGIALAVSLAVYVAIRFLAYRRSFPLSHQFDFLWVVATLLVIFLVCVEHPPLENSFTPRFLSWATFLTFLLCSYMLIFVLDQFIVEYFLVMVLKLYVSPPLRKAILLFVFAIAVLVGMQKIFNMNPWAIYAPTGAISLGIGIALKDAFQTFFAGLALSRIVRIGDWIRLDDKEGEVEDINWARTVLRTWEGTRLFIPNSDLQKGIFYNYDYADPRQRCRLEVGSSYDAPPQKVKSVLLGCVQNVDGVLTAPPPEVLLLNYAESAVQYALTFWVGKYARHREITSEVATRIWYAFKRENIAIPYPIRTVHMIPEKDQAKAPEPESILSNIDLFKMLPPNEKQVIVERLHRQVYLKGEVVVREGENGGSFFIVIKGNLEVLKQKKDGSPTVIGALSAGQFFGELALLTGEPRSATIKAVTDSELLRLEKSDFKEILERHPSLADTLAEVVSSRQAVLVQHSAKESPVEEQAENKRSAISRKIREFFNIQDLK